MPFNCEHHSNFDQAGTLTTAEWENCAPFARHSWFARLHAHCLTSAPPEIITIGDASGAVRLYCVRAGSFGLAAMANWYSFSWAPASRGTSDTATYTAMIASAFRQLRTSAARISLYPIAAHDGTLSTLTEALGGSGWHVIAEPTGQNYWLDTRGRSFDEWWAQRPGALRSTVQRKAKKGRVALAVHSQFDDMLWDDYEAVYRQSWKPRESHPNFLRAWARDEAANGRLRLGIARIDGAPAAAQFWTVDNGIAYIHKLAHVADRDALSPGTLLTHTLFAHAFDHDRVARIDFGTGDDGYKRDWMEQSGALFTVRAWDLRQASSWPSFIRVSGSRLAAKLRRR